MCFREYSFNCQIKAVNWNSFLYFVTCNQILKSEINSILLFLNDHHLSIFWRKYYTLSNSLGSKQSYVLIAQALWLQPREDPISVLCIDPCFDGYYSPGVIISWSGDDVGNSTMNWIHNIIASYSSYKHSYWIFKLKIANGKGAVNFFYHFLTIGKSFGGDSEYKRRIITGESSLKTWIWHSYNIRHQQPYTPEEGWGWGWGERGETVYVPNETVIFPLLPSHVTLRFA